MTRILIILALFLNIAVSSFAAKTYPVADPEENRLSRSEWWAKMTDMKANFIANQLGLDEETKAKFVKLYISMQNETERVTDEMRNEENKVRKMGKNATDKDMLYVTELEFNLKAQHGKIEKSYFPKFKSILTPAQMFQMSGAERKFNQNMMRHNKSKARSAERKRGRSK